MFMNVHGGISLKPLVGRWMIKEQAANWTELDPVIHGYYNRNIPVTMNVLPGTKCSILMKAGNEVIAHHGCEADLPFASYPSHVTDQSGYEIMPSGIDPALHDLQFIETRIIVREEAYYQNKPPITVQITFEQGNQKFERTYQLQLTYDNILSKEENPFVVDLALAGIPFSPTYAGWQGIQPITGEYIYSRTDPMEALVIFNGYSVDCFVNGLPATLSFPAFEPVKLGKHELRLTTQKQLFASLDMCMAGLQGIASNESFPAVFTPVPVNGSGFQYYLWSTTHGTYIVPPPKGIYCEVYFATQQLSSSQFLQMLGSKKLYEFHEINHPLRHHRIAIGSVSFWSVMSIRNDTHVVPPDSLSLPFVHGMLRNMVKYPLWWKRFGEFPKP